MANDLCLTHYACPQKLEGYKRENRTQPYHVLFPEPRLLHYVIKQLNLKSKALNIPPYTPLPQALATCGKSTLIWGQKWTYYIRICVYLVESASWCQTCHHIQRHIPELTPAEVTELKVKSLEHPSLHTIATNIDSLREEYANLRTKVDLLHSDMGLLRSKVDELICLTSLVHHSSKLAIPFKQSDLNRAKGVYLVSLVKTVPITINHSFLKTVFSLKFTDPAPPSLTRKMAKDLGWIHISELTPAEATELKVQSPEHPPLHTIAANIDSLREEHADLGTKVDLLNSDMGLLGRKVDELIHLTTLVHHGAKLAIPFKQSDLDRASTAADHLIQSSSPHPHFT
ncbi:hypothetical protein Cgig2_025055 [Carnegiea gigantea]|uniref:Uncharacterized protein n=1 Tax=Carnegiea gigantea TaxID=171969 RepID=A0A9Q1JNK8_9CARY|nr:hypothetical protein Cgig2_025055 [Carnegiea gigantea]